MEKEDDSKKQEKEPFIIKQISYTDHLNRSVIEAVCVIGKLPEDFERYKGRGILNLRNASGAIFQQVPLEFFITGVTSVEEAYSKWNDVFLIECNQYVKVMKEKATSQIVVPNSGELPHLPRDGMRGMDRGGGSFQG